MGAQYSLIEDNGKSTDTIQEEVLTQWLQGIAKDMIAKNVGKNQGTYWSSDIKWRILCSIHCPTIDV